MECKKFTTHISGAMQGFADIYVPKWRAIVHGCRLFMKDGRRWVTLPSNKYEHRDGGEAFSPTMSFDSKEFDKAFSEQAKKAIDEWCAKNANGDPNCGLSDEPQGEEVPF